MAEGSAIDKDHIQRSIFFKNKYIKRTPLYCEMGKKEVGVVGD